MSLVTLASGGRRRGWSEPLRTLEPGILRVGTYFVNPPFEYVVNGANVGFEVDLMGEVARRLGLKPLFVNTHWETILKEMQDGAMTASWAASPSRPSANGCRVVDSQPGDDTESGR